MALDAAAPPAEVMAEHLADVVGRLMADRALRLVEAWRPGSLVCVRCERAVPLAEWRRRCPHCHGRRSWAPDSETSETVAAS